MTAPVPMTEIRRGGMLESLHLGHAVICDAEGGIVRSWGDPGAVIFPRSSAKMLQALPLVTSGAADRAGLTPEHLALACASHNGARIHTDRVAAWLRDLGLDEGDFRCGPQVPDDPEARKALTCSDEAPCQLHNNCSGKHAGFLTLNRHLKGGPEYIEVDHPVQRAVREAFEAATGETSPGWGIDGCSAPNFTCTVAGLARAMGRFAGAAARSGTEAEAQVRLTQAMMAHPELVAGEGRACTELMRAAKGALALKTGADGVFVAILPQKQLGVALKIADGATRGSECAIAAILCHLGVLDPDHPATRKRMNAPIRSRLGLEAGLIAPAPGFV